VRLTVYLHPDRGPITPVLLDLFEIYRTLTPPGPADGLGEGELAPLCEAIRRSHRGVRPESNLAGLARVYANFRHADRFDGVVLRVEGEIPAAQGAPDDRRLEAIRAEIRRRDQEIQRLQAELRSERALLSQVTDRLQRSEQALEAALRQAEALRTDLSGARAERDRAARANEGLAATLAARDRSIEELRARRRPPGPSDEPFPVLES